MKVRILGSGTSSGVPRIGNDWGTCDPGESRNRRLRSSILVTHGNTNILVDTSPDLREQLLAAETSKIDAVIWTHDHADHCHGIDDLRQVYHAIGRPVPGFARPETLAALQARFAYAFSGRAGYPPTVEGHTLPDRLVIGDIIVTVADQPHGSITSAGLRFEANNCSIGYATDFNIMTAEMQTLYEKLDVWIVDALRELPHPTHPDLKTALGYIKTLDPARAALVHMDQTMDYRSLCAMLPEGVVPGHDGLELP